MGMKWKTIAVSLAGFSLATTFTISAVSNNFLNDELLNQSKFVLNVDNKDMGFDMNCDDTVNVIDNIMLKNIMLSETSRYNNNIFQDVSIEKDVIYAQKKDYQQNDIDLALDIYKPETDDLQKHPVIIWVHGGGMYTGSKDDASDPVNKLALDFAKKGYVCISIDYRLNPTWETTGLFTETMTDCAEDVASVVEWVRQNADTYNINTNYIALG